ncbi:hypothetical protein UY3_11829 [Chelonia mydas]|uniref:Myb/SANT-like DNA-binding domain-containing protein n=1 Tax=Chelonia mydas TaxID=8469 RepID=M7BSE3_CHEMY|nr:hypothetical protein UY3_11829 [Chelonia mydas]
MQVLVARMKHHHEKCSFSGGSCIEDDERNMSEHAGSSELRSKRRNAKIFEKISKGMKDRGYNRDPQQCSVKLKELRQAYQRTREAIGRSGSEPQTCRFYEELQAFLGGSPTTTPALCVDSVNGLSHNRDADFGDKEDDKEKEVEAQQASRETVFPNSQEQFLTLDLVPSQPTEGGLPDPEGGEGTSAPNVSSLHVSSLSQRLSKIRSWKKRKLICSGVWLKGRKGSRSTYRRYSPTVTNRPPPQVP